MILPTSYALMKNARGRYVLGHGPFTEHQQCPPSGVAFYVNDFSLSNTTPWKVPSKVEYFDDFPSIESEDKGPIKCDWQAPQADQFAEVFAEVNQSLLKGEIQKSVPVATEKGKLLAGDPSQLIFRKSPAEVYNAYAWCDEDKGFCGLTPEVLFSYEKGRLRTMALAGTADINEKDIFSVDEKEIREHEFVAQTLISKLNEIGMVQPESRRIMELQTLIHFYTPIYVGLYDAMPLESLIKRLHPTPALGPLPRTQASMADLVKWRNQLDCPSHFGAPMGVYDQGEFHSVVCIRGVHWNANDVLLPAGCGVIEASRLMNEWRELQLKRESVKRLFAL